MITFTYVLCLLSFWATLFYFTNLIVLFMFTFKYKEIGILNGIHEMWNVPKIFNIFVMISGIGTLFILNFLNITLG